MTKNDIRSTAAVTPARELSRDDLLALYFFMRLTRETDNTILRLYKQGKVVGGAYTSHGNEATAVGSAFALGPQVSDGTW
jgi:TPP-dependent pyruvate/acetoin dehydrogenase alpha subunit